MKKHKRKISSLLCVSAAVLLAATTAAASERFPAAAGDPDQQMMRSIRPSPISAADEERRVHSKGIGGDHVITVPAAAFGHNGNDPNGFRFYEFGGYIRGTPTGYYCGMAPVYLPHGATITELWASVIDEDSSSNVSITLSRVDTTGYHSSDELATITTSGSSTTIQKPYTFTLNFAEVDFPRYAYYLFTCLPSDSSKLYSVRVWYDNPELFSDGFETGNSKNWSDVIGAAKGLVLPEHSGEEDAEQEIAIPLFDKVPPEMQKTLRDQIKAYGNPLVIPAADFMHNGQYPGEVKDSTAGYIHAAGFGDVYTQAPVYLPDGATVASVWALVYDNDDSCSSTDMSIWMNRTDNTTATMDQMTFFTSSGADTSHDWILDIEPEFPEIQYPNYEYYILARLCSANHRLYAVMIFYGTP